MPRDSFPFAQFLFLNTQGRLVISRQDPPKLATAALGVAILIQAWTRLREALDASNGWWEETEISAACDLLGIARHPRNGRLPFEPADAAEDLTCTTIAAGLSSTSSTAWRGSSRG
jgi:hypothetical protein